ncbi:NAD(P)-binding protein [Ceraceosorus guamensis]|uniref:NAD(P)-binding protein n=1 Tax=Ceraceosorus guamensis TaxID=1522189 RepID=A0A316VXR1_9BASI|nr:NAD(P)-binding protein [Ceraceosorus guamensis]PWN41081.1 NAD(P)-binding protein [Ceraceosorus guamensis]
MVTADGLVHVASRLTSPTASPLAYVGLAAVLSVKVRDALNSLIYFPTRDNAKGVLGVLWRALNDNAWLKVFVAISAIRFINRLGQRIIYDRAAPRTIQWSEHVVVISGGARGIGGGLAEKLADKGAKVVTIDKLERTDHAREDLHIVADVTSEEELLAARAQVHEKFGLVSFVVSCAGIARHCMVLDPPEQFPASYSTAIHRVNIDGTYTFVKVFGQDLLPAYNKGQLRVEGGQPANGFGGHILMIASGAPYSPLPANASYNLSKAGVITLWQSLNFELDAWHKTNNVRSSIICPLMVHSKMTEGRMLEQKNQFLFPTLTIDKVANRMVDILEKDQSVQAHLPAAAYAISLISPNTPPYFMRAIYKALGAHQTFMQWAAKERNPVADH